MLGMPGTLTFIKDLNGQGRICLPALLRAAFRKDPTSNRDGSFGLTLEQSVFAGAGGLTFG